MSKYFSAFPKILYSFDDYKNYGNYITNIISRFSFEEKLKNNTAAFFLYAIREGETPETVAAKYYDSPYRHWIILMMNDIIDPQYQWPLHSDALNEYIDKKYMEESGYDTPGSGILWAQSNIKYYYKIESIQLKNEIINTIAHEIDADTYDNLIPTTENPLTLDDGNIITIITNKTHKSYYDYEIEENESKREIKLLRKEFVTPLENELKRVFA